MALKLAESLTLSVTAAAAACGLAMASGGGLLLGVAAYVVVGSITLISGILSEEPINWGVSATTINGAIEHFVKAAACELPKGLRINVVSPTVLTESMDKYADFFPGFVPVPAAKVALAYQKSVLGVQTGQVFKVNG